MTAPLHIGQTVTIVEDGRERTGTVEVTRKNGAAGVIRTMDGEIIPIRADQIGKQTDTAVVSVDLDEAVGLAAAVLDGDHVPGSVTGQLLKLAAAVITLRNGRAA